MEILSLFDGMGCGQIALEKAGITVDKYYSSEVDPHCIKVTQSNYPKTIQLGDVRKIDINGLSNIDLLIGGSPCQGFSIAGRKLNFDDMRSALFFDYVKILEKLNPKYFLLENVRMSDDIADAIDSEMGVKRIFINSKDFTGHIRKRYYWTNIPINAWVEKDIPISEIIDKSVPYDRDLNFLLDRTEYKPSVSSDGIITINPRDKNGKQTWQRGRVYDITGNCPTICATLFDLNITQDHKHYRKLTINECEKLQGVPIDYTNSAPYVERGKMLGNGWTVDVISHIFSNIEVRRKVMKNCEICLNIKSALCYSCTDKNKFILRNSAKKECLECGCRDGNGESKEGGRTHEITCIYKKSFEAQRAKPKSEIICQPY